MAFSEDQIRHLRGRLNTYREREGRNGRARPWKSVLDDILMAEVTRHEYPEDGSLPEFREEALRRFAAGTSVLTEDKLEDIAAFLLDCGYLAAAELGEAEDDYPAAIALGSYLGKGQLSTAMLEALAGDYRATRSQDDMEFGFELAIGMTSDPGIATVRQAFEAFWTPHADHPAAGLRKIAGRQLTMLRSGYGFVAEGLGIYIFLKDKLTRQVSALFVSSLAAGAFTNRDVGWFKAAYYQPPAAEAPQPPSASGDEPAEGSVPAYTFWRSAARNQEPTE